jgi:aminoglycoside 3-N-acetyltransferase
VLTEELGIKAGDKILVSSGFSQLNSDGYTPKQVVELLEDIVTAKGLIMMPYYPPMNSDEWVKSGNVFSMTETKSGMGIITNVFSHMPDVVKSEHPTKAVCAWGKGAKEIVKDHYLDIDPFGKNTPYGKLLEMSHTKSLCLGVGNIPIFHAYEDKYIPFDNLYYDKEPHNVKLQLENGKIINCVTWVHSAEKLNRLIPARTYVDQFSDPINKKVKFGFNYIAIADNTLLMEACEKEFAKGNTREKR